MKIAIATLVVIICVLGWRLHSETAASQGQRDRIRELELRLQGETTANQQYKEQIQALERHVSATPTTLDSNNSGVSERTPAVQGEPVVEDSESAACDVLKSRIAELYMDTKKVDPYWFCEGTVTENEYIRILALRSNFPRMEEGAIYSNLLGWFAVARRSSLVLEWDVGEDRLVPMSAR